MTGKGHLSDVSDEEWALVVPYLNSMRRAAPQRDHSLRGALNGLRYIVRSAMQWRIVPNALPEALVDAMERYAFYYS
jgi:transposase